MPEYRENNITQPFVLISKYFSGKANPDEISAIINWKNISAENKIFYKYCCQNYIQNGRFDLYFDVDLRYLWNCNSEDIQEERVMKSSSIYILTGVFIMSFLISIATIHFTGLFKRVCINAKYESIKNVLPDGSKYELFDGSAIFYASDFENNNRIIKLDGVMQLTTYNNNHPFILTSGGFSAEINNASIQITAIKKNPIIEISVNKGIIKIFRDINNNNPVIAGPGERIILSRKDGDIIIRQV